MATDKAKSVQNAFKKHGHKEGRTAQDEFDEARRQLAKPGYESVQSHRTAEEIMKAVGMI